MMRYKPSIIIEKCSLHFHTFYKWLFYDLLVSNCSFLNYKEQFETGQKSFLSHEAGQTFANCGANNFLFTAYKFR